MPETFLLLRGKNDSLVLNKWLRLAYSHALMRIRTIIIAQVVFSELLSHTDSGSADEFLGRWSRMTIERNDIVCRQTIRVRLR